MKCLVCKSDMFDPIVRLNENKEPIVLQYNCNLCSKHWSFLTTKHLNYENANDRVISWPFGGRISEATVYQPT